MCRVISLLPLPSVLDVRVAPLEPEVSGNTGDMMLSLALAVLGGWRLCG